MYELVVKGLRMRWLCVGHGMLLVVAITGKATSASCLDGCTLEIEGIIAEATDLFGSYLSANGVTVGSPYRGQFFWPHLVAEMDDEYLATYRNFISGYAVVTLGTLSIVESEVSFEVLADRTRHDVHIFDLVGFGTHNDFNLQINDYEKGMVSTGIDDALRFAANTAAADEIFHFFPGNTVAEEFYEVGIEVTSIRVVPEPNPVALLSWLVVLWGCNRFR